MISKSKEDAMIDDTKNDAKAMAGDGEGAILAGRGNPIRQLARARSDIYGVGLEMV